MKLLPFATVTAEDVQRLIDDETQEQASLDYKRELPGKGDESRREFGADVSSFANADGGTIVFGLSDRKDLKGRRTGKPQIHGIQNLNGDAEFNRMEGWLREKVQPRLLVRRHEVTLKSGEQLLILVVPKSWGGPHMAEDGCFYTRGESGKSKMNYLQVRDAFSRSANLADRIRGFRMARLAALVGRDTPIDMIESPKIVLHIIPMSTFDNPGAVDIHAWEDLKLGLSTFDGFGGHFNTDGYIRYSDRHERDQRSYAQLYRNGIVEITTDCISTRRGNPRCFNVDRAEKSLFDDVQAYLGHLTQVGVEPPFAVSAGLIKVCGIPLDTPLQETPDLSLAPRREVVTLPDVLVEAADWNDLPRRLKPIADAIWQSFGSARSLSFDAAGNRRSPSR